MNIKKIAIVGHGVSGATRALAEARRSNKNINDSYESLAREIQRLKLQNGKMSEFLQELVKNPSFCGHHPTALIKAKSLIRQFLEI